MCKGGSIIPLKLAAVRAGLGWQRKHSLLISKQFGTFLALGGIITNARLEHTEKEEPNRCGSCTACQDACPTRTLDKPYVLNRRRCLSNALQNESLPKTIRPILANHIIDCEICQLVCPWNRKHLDRPLETKITQVFQQQIERWNRFFYLPDLARLSESEYKDTLEHLNSRIPYHVFRRNVRVAKENAEEGVV